MLAVLAQHDPRLTKVWQQQTSSVATGFSRHGMPQPPPTPTFDRLTLKLVCESHLRWGTFLPNLGMPGLCILKLFAMYATDGQKQRLLHNNDSHKIETARIAIVINSVTQYYTD